MSEKNATLDEVESVIEQITTDTDTRFTVDDYAFSGGAGEQTTLTITLRTVPKTGELHGQRDRIKTVKELIADMSQHTDDELGASIDAVVTCACELGMDVKKVRAEIDRLRTRGEIYDPRDGRVSLT
jgi:DNA replicative helicase MCM subunit Mcm2 (Cdc46/Mcm family)